MYYIPTALTCGPNSMFREAASACPASCLDPRAPESCDQPRREGCECLPGYLMSGHQCVPREQCGCRDQYGRYYAVSGTCIQSHLST